MQVLGCQLSARGDITRAATLFGFGDNLVDDALHLVANRGHLLDSHDGRREGDRGAPVDGNGIAVELAWAGPVPRHSLGFRVDETRTVVVEQDRVVHAVDVAVQVLVLVRCRAALDHAVLARHEGLAHASRAVGDVVDKLSVESLGIFRPPVLGVAEAQGRTKTVEGPPHLVARTDEPVADEVALFNHRDEAARLQRGLKVDTERIAADVALVGGAEGVEEARGRRHAGSLEGRAHLL
mmetsp:Transcript_5113/g.11355  ORF Transcript_5113/g.11355 Transcript_5113/m.11355 type:complete len:238 (-) Transcript_5113:1529-2242(-)